MPSLSASSVWSYNARGRKANADHTIANVTRSFGWSYDSTDRITSITYPAFPNGIALTASYAYDAPGRPLSLHTRN